MKEKFPSYNSFLVINNLEDKNESLQEYSLALDSLRLALATERGITIDELHLNFNNLSE